MQGQSKTRNTTSAELLVVLPNSALYQVDLTMLQRRMILVGAALVLAALLYVLKFGFGRELYYNFKRWEEKGSSTHIIILTYMRSGSTLTGRLLEHDRDVFYVFEPMHSLKWIWWSKHVKLHFLSEMSRRVETSEEFSEEAVRIANGFLHCNLVDLDIATLSQDHLQQSSDTYPYHACIMSKGGGVDNIIPCLDILYQSCSKSSVRVFKTIRFPMKTAENMMVSNPSLKVVHLIRDPRPTINSQIFYGRSEGMDLAQYSQEFCNRVEEDLEATKRMMMRYPGRVMLLQYEDLTINPVEHVKELYSFVGLEFTDETVRFVQSLTASETETVCPLCVQSVNSAERSLEWRNKVQYEMAHTIDENCKNVSQSLGYVAVESAGHLTDLTRSLKTEIKF